MAIRQRLGQPGPNRVPVDTGHCRQDGRQDGCPI